MRNHQLVSSKFNQQCYNTLDQVDRRVTESLKEVIYIGKTIQVLEKALLIACGIIVKLGLNINDGWGANFTAETLAHRFVDQACDAMEVSNETKS